MNKIVIKLSNAIKASELSYNELEKRSGISKSALQRYASGQTKKIPLEVITILSRVLNVNPAYLMDFDDNISEPIASTTTFIKLPLYQNISCGKGSFIEDNIIDYITIPDQMIKKDRDYFACYASGNSMINENINDGDLIIFEKTNSIENGEIGCFCIDEENATCKIFRKDTKTGIIMLLPANNECEAITVTLENQNFRIVGKLSLVVNNRQK